MTDVFDRAQEREQQDRDIAIRRALTNGGESELPDDRDGVRYCLDCGLKIPEERLRIRPESVRCVDCKFLKEQRGRR